MSRPGVTLAVAGLVVAVAGWAASRLEPSAALDAMMARDDPAARALVAIAADFGSFDDLWLLVTRPAGDAEPGALESFATRFAAEVAADDALTGSVLRVDSGGEGDAERAFFEREVVPRSVLYLDEDGLATLRDRLTPASMAEQMQRNETLIAAPGAAADAVGRAILRDPLRLREIIAPRFAALEGTVGSGFVSRDGRSRLIRVAGTRPATDLAFTREFLAAVQAAAARANTGGLMIEFTGGYAIAAASERAIRGDMIRSVFAAVLLMQVVFLVAYRRFASFPAALLPAAAGIVVAFGVYAATGRTLTPVTAVVGAILAGLGIDYGVHLLSHAHRHREAGGGMAGAARTAVRTLAAPLSVAALSSIVGLVAIGRSSVPAVRDFALLAALGLGGALLATLLVLPALLAVLERGSGTGRAATRGGLEHLVAGVGRRPAWWAAATGVAWLATGLVIAGGSRGAWPMDRDLDAMHPRPNPALALQDVIAERFGGVPSGLAVLVRGGPDTLVAASHRVAESLAGPATRAVGVQGVFGLATLLPDPAAVPVRRVAAEAIDAERVVADFHAAVDASLFDPEAFEDYAAFLGELLRPGPAPTLDTLRAYPDVAATVLPRAAIRDGVEPAATLGIVRLARPLSTLETRAAAVTAMRDALASVPEATLTGLSVIGHDTQGRIRGDLTRLLALAAVAVLVLLLVYLRHPLDVALTLLPVGFGLTCLLASMTLTGDGFNMINLIALPLLAGIGVDDGIFIVSIARSARRAGDSAATLRNTLAASAHAITVTSATSGLAFGSLLFTSTPAIQSLGRMTAIGIAACWAATMFCLVPIVLARAHRGAS